jgi:hypothetical protein
MLCGAGIIWKELSSYFGLDSWVNLIDYEDNEKDLGVIDPV